MRLALELVAVFLAVLIAGAAGQGASACPVNDFSRVDWNTAKGACANLDDTAFCSTCICGVGIALVTGLDAAGVKINGQPISSLAGADSSTINTLLGQCSTTLGVQLLQSGALNAAAVAQLSKCDAQAAGSNCLSQVQSGAINPAAVVAQSGAAPPPAPAPQRSSGQGVGSPHSLKALWAAVLAALAAGLLLLG